MEIFLRGRSLQAETLFRHFMELLDIVILILLDEDFFQAYRIIPTDETEAKKHWYKTKPSIINKKIEGYLKLVELPSDYLKAVLTYRNDTYSRYSKSVHGSLIGVMSSLYKEDDDNCIMNPFAFNNSLAPSYFQRFVFYNWTMLFVLMLAFIKKHNSPMNKFGDLGGNFVNSFKYLEHLNKVITIRLKNLKADTEN